MLGVRPCRLMQYSVILAWVSFADNDVADPLASIQVVVDGQFLGKVNMLILEVGFA